MIIEKAVSRIGWRLSGLKTFTPNQGDIEAYNNIVDYVAENLKKMINSSLNYCKQ